MLFYRKIKQYSFLILLILISIFLCYKNYTPHTFLSGWDTLHPEFNFGQYLKRIFSVWQEHQGLGAPPSQAHASEISRMIIYGILMIIFSLNFVRYSYIFLMVIIGPIGIYLFLEYIINKERTNNYLNTSISCFLGSLFYLLNIGTMQHFAVPLEMFVTKFGYLGFIFLYATKYIDKDKIKHLCFFLIFIFLSTSMAHTATLWYVFYFGLILYLISYSYLKKSGYKKAMILIVFTLLVNAFWILPNIYYSVNYSPNIINSKIHRLFSEEAYYHNKNYGNFKDFLLFKNFLFDWRIYSEKNQNQYLFAPWIAHLNNPYIIFISWTFSLFCLMGLILSIRKRNFKIISFIPVLIFCSFFLLSDIKPLSFFFDFLRNEYPLFKEILRFPFTKFSLYVIFIFSLLFGYYHSILLHKITVFIKRNATFFQSLYFYFFLFLIVLYAIPSFEGYFINPVVRINIPSEYFSLFSWSKQQDEGRMLTLPFQGLFGWVYYRFPFETGNQIYQGAGFTWFGLKQPTLNREFDRWYPYNEQNYREFFYAINSQNLNLFENLLEKYNIKYILLDENVIFPGDQNQQKKLLYDELKQLLNSSKKITLTKKFGEKITIYEYLNKKGSLAILTGLKNIQPKFHWNYIDQAYQENGDYYSSFLNNDITDTIYPGNKILDEKERINKNIVQIQDDLSYKLDFGLDNKTSGKIFIPDFFAKEKEIYANLYLIRKPQELKIQIELLLPYVQEKNPYVFEFPIPNEKGKIFSINNYSFNIPDDTYIRSYYLGEVILNTQEKNIIAFYNTDYQKTLAVKLPSLNPYLCSTKTSQNQVFGAEKTNAGFKIYGSNSKICLDLPLDVISNSLSVDNAINLNFKYLTDPKANFEFCVFDKKNNNCLNKQVIKNNSISNESFSTLFALAGKDPSSFSLNFLFDLTSEEELKTLYISDIILNSYEAIKKEVFAYALDSSIIENSNLKIKGDFSQNKTFLDLKSLLSDNKYCSFNKPTYSSKKNVGDENAPIIEYSSKNGSICEIISLPNLSQNIGYLLAVESQNLNGLPLKICFEDDINKICIFEDVLSVNKKNLQTDYFVIPPYKNAFGYNLLVDNISFGNSTTINQLKSIKIIPFPYSFLQSIKFQINKDIKEKQIISPVSQKKITPYLYTVNISNIEHNDDILFFDQAYEKGWKAWVNGKEIKDHVLVNNWANGWALRQGSAPQGTKIVIIFWPQYLEFAGFGLLILAVLVIVKKNDLKKE